MAKVVELESGDFKLVEPLFEAFDSDRSLIGGVLEGNQIGRVFCEDAPTPRVAALFHPGEYGYVAGDPEVGDLRSLVEEVPCTAGVDVEEYEFLMPRNSTWIAHLNAVFGDRLKRDGYEYFTFTDSKMDWIRKWSDRLPDGVKIVQMDRDLARRAEKAFHVAAVACWGSVERFIDGGFGFDASECRSKGAYTRCDGWVVFCVAWQQRRW